MTLPVHPETGLHYGIVMTRAWGALVDMRACYDHVATQLPWLTVVTPGQEVDYDDPDLFLLFWEPQKVPERSARRATTAYVYVEALDPHFERMLPQHRAHFQGIAQQHAQGCYDGILAHTPYMSLLLESLLGQGRVPVLPAGWEPEVMGRPRGTLRSHSLVYHGTPVGRREVLVPYLLDRLGGKLINATGRFGRGLIGALEAAHGSLYIAHSSVASFSTWRLWQALAAGCAVVAEPGDTWPFEGGAHYVPIGPFTLDNAVDLGNRLAELADDHAMLEATAARAYAALGHFTTRYCIEHYLLPASVEIRHAH